MWWNMHHALALIRKSQKATLTRWPEQSIRDTIITLPNHSSANCASQNHKRSVQSTKSYVTMFPFHDDDLPSWPTAQTMWMRCIPFRHTPAVNIAGGEREGKHRTSCLSTYDISNSFWSCSQMRCLAKDTLWATGNVHTINIDLCLLAWTCKLINTTITLPMRDGGLHNYQLSRHIHT